MDKEKPSEPEEIYQLIYLSSATHDLSETELKDILSKSQSRNASRGISGLLLYSEGNFIQIIEGPQKAVNALFSSIRKDRRHSNVTAVIRRFVEKRDFPTYHMGFRRVSKKKADMEIPGFSDIVEKRHIPEEVLATLSSHVSVFLKSFAKVNRILD